jgi:hypothetical protein
MMANGGGEGGAGGPLREWERREGSGVMMREDFISLITFAESKIIGWLRVDLNFFELFFLFYDKLYGLFLLGRA